MVLGVIHHRHHYRLALRLLIAIAIHIICLGLYLRFATVSFSAKNFVFTKLSRLSAGDGHGKQRPNPIIYEATANAIEYLPIRDEDFTSCSDFSNCKIVRRSNQPVATPGTPKISDASLVLFTRSSFDDQQLIPELPWEVRAKQLWVMRTHECPRVYRFPRWYDGLFNLTMTYRLDSDIPNPWYTKLLKKDTITAHKQPAINYKKNKTKGGLALMTHCDSHGYNRMDTVNRLQQYINIDVIGSCGTPDDTCGRMDYECEERTYQKYHFFMAFENSLCDNYITEKFWTRLASKANFLPVAIGDTSMHLYTKMSPPNSFIHLYNFSSIEALGEYLKTVIENEEIYNSYHKWRDSYVFENDMREAPNNPCELCRLANEMPNLLAIDDLSKWFNDGHCNSLFGLSHPWLGYIYDLIFDILLGGFST